MGWFRNPCRGTMYSMAGQRACGPSPRGLDRLAVEIRDGGVFVDLRAITSGARRPPGGSEFRERPPAPWPADRMSGEMACTRCCAFREAQ